MRLSRVIPVWAIAGLAITLGLAVSGCAGPQADASGSAPTNSPVKRTTKVTAEMRALGDALDDLLDLEDVSDKDTSWADDFAWMRYHDGTVEISWVGSLPTRVTDVIAQHPTVTTVIHEDAKYTRIEMDDAQTELVHFIDDERGLGPDTTFHFISRSQAGDSFEAEIYDRSGAWTGVELESLLSEHIGFPVSVKLKPWPTSSPDSVG